FFVVHMTICEPFQTKPIGTLRGVPSLATYARRVRSRANNSLLSGRFRISVISFCCMVMPSLADLLRQCEDDALGAEQIAQPVRVLVLHHLVADDDADVVRPLDHAPGTQPA